MRQRWAGAGLRRRARAVYLIVSVLGGLALLATALTFLSVLDARERLAGRVDPAAVTAQTWLAATVDQESGVRGFVLSEDQSFLEPYLVGTTRADAAERAIRNELRDEPDLLGLVGEFDAATDAWRRDNAEPLIASARDEGPGSVTEADLSRSKRSFDELRRAFGRMDDAITEAREDARGDLDRLTEILVLAIVVAGALAAAGTGATWAALNRWVLEPVATLGEDARRVAGGDLDHEVAATGPPDLADLAGDVEAMRQRIVEELALVETARAQLEEQAADLARSNQELEQFAYVASHDLQEPLRKITGFCQLLQRRYEGQLDDRADEYIAFAVDGAKRMQQLINDLLAFSRVGRSTEAFVPVDLAAAASLAVRTLQAPIEEAGATVTVGRLPTVLGDASLLETLFQNLVGNAVKFRGDDPPTVAITADRQGDEWHFACADDGIGIEPQFAERVFVIFQRLNDRESYAGTGIGLALCRKLVEYHGGRIWVDPDVPVGTTIRWTLPVTPPDIPSETTPGEPS